MKKLLLVVLALISSLSVYAADLKVTGDFSTSGNAAGNDTLEKSGKTNYMYFDYDLNVNAAFVANENATVFTKLTYDKNVKGSGKVDKVEGAKQEMSTSLLAVERAYLAYKFNPMFKLDAGLMGGGQWGTAFGNTEINVMRVKGTAVISDTATVMAIYQKNKEVGAVDVAKDGEKYDDNTYYLAGTFKFGTITLSPLFSYNPLTTVSAGSDVEANTLSADVALTGDFGMIGFEAEGVYASTSGDTKATKFGAYANVFAKVEPAKVGLVLAYASDKTDSDKGVYSWGKDFDVTVVMDDWIETTIAGWTVAKVYADATFGAISCGAAVAYGMDNLKDSDAAFTEIDANAGYTFDANTSWTITAGYAMTDKCNTTGDKANAYAMYHTFKVTF